MESHRTAQSQRVFRTLQVSDFRGADVLLADLPDETEEVIGDRGYDSNQIRLLLAERNIRALLEIRYDRFSRGFECDSKAGCGRQHNEAAWPELHARRNAIRLI